MAKKAGTFEVNEHLFLCDGATANPRNDKQKVHTLKTGRKRVKDEIHLEIGSLKEHLSDNLPDVMKDLLEIATFIYVAGQLTARGGMKELEYGYKWHRKFDLAIPVREYDVWTDLQTKDLLEDLLSFVSGEHYTFHFTQKTKEIPEFLELQDSSDDPHNIKEVVLFSGGMDSFAGAVDEITEEGKKIALVSHCSEPKIIHTQNEVYKYLTEHCTGPKPLHVPVHIWKGGKYVTVDTNQRNRSFLFASLGALVATTVGLKQARFYENGIISCNLPFDSQTPQARRTRSTHPKFLTEMGELIERITGEVFRFKNPYFTMTRTDIVNRILERQQPKGIGKTRSCAKSRYSGPRHDGVCSQCVDRRFATLAAKCLEYDPQKDYQIDIFLDELEKKANRTMVLGYLHLSDKIPAFTKEQFYEHFSSDLIEITNFMGISRTEAITQVYNIYRNHAHQVNSVVYEKIKQYTPDIVHGLLPKDCMLNMVSHQEHKKYPMLAKQETDGVKKHGKGKLERKVRYHHGKDPNATAREIAGKIGGTASVASVKQVKARINKEK